MYNMEMKSNTDLFRKINDFLDSITTNHSENELQMESFLIDNFLTAIKVSEHQDIEVLIRHIKGNKVNYQDNESSEPIVPKEARNRSDFDLLMWNELEIARQLTLMAIFRYQKIEPFEFLNENWLSKDSDEYSPNIVKMIERFRCIYGWVIEEILSYDRSSMRALVVEKFILIANELYNMNNYNDLVNIISALNSLPIRKLNKTFSKTNKELLVQYTQLSNICDSKNEYFNLRQQIQSSKGKPCVPFLGLILKDVHLVNKEPYLVDDTKINVEKVRKFGSLIEDFSSYKNYTYKFKPLFKLSFLASPESMNENALMDLSCNLGIIYLFRTCFQAWGFQKQY